MTGHGWRDARTAKGITLRALAAMVGISPPFLSDVEHGRRRFSAATEAKVRSALGLPPAAPDPGDLCVVCETPLRIDTSSVYDPSTGPMIIGPRGTTQIRRVTTITCPQCGLWYAHSPKGGANT